MHFTGTRDKEIPLFTQNKVHLQKIRRILITRVFLAGERVNIPVFFIIVVDG